MTFPYTSCWNWKQQAGKPGILPNHPPQHFRVLSWLKLECEWCNTWPNMTQRLVRISSRHNLTMKYNEIQFNWFTYLPVWCNGSLTCQACTTFRKPWQRQQKHAKHNLRNDEKCRNATFEQQSLPRMNNPYQSITKPTCAWKVTGAEWEPFANDLTNLYHRIWCDIICDDLTCTVPCHDATWTVYRFSSFWCTIQRTDQA